MTTTTTMLLVQLSLLPLAIFFTVKLSFSLFSPLKQTENTPNEPPQPSGRLPVIGHLHLLGWSRAAALTLGDLADKYGPLITLWAGRRRVVVVSSWDIAKECLTTHDKVLASRPKIAAGKLLGYDNTMLIVAPHGAYWRQVRKLLTLRLLSARQLELLKHVRAQEINLWVHRLYKKLMANSNPQRVELKNWLSDLTFNMMCMILVSKRYYGEEKVENEVEAAKFRVAMERALYLTGNLIPSDGIPCLEWLDLGGYMKKMKRTMKELDAIASSWVEAHRRRRSEELGEERKSGDFMDVILETMQDAPMPDCDIEVAIKAIALNIILASTDTTHVAMTWAVSLLVNNKQVLKKAQEEIDQLVGKERNVEESDVPNLPYLQAIFKEALRLYPSAPLGVPHEAMEDTNISGYRIPAGTMVIFNLWKIHRDPTVWEEPSKFKPERFPASNSHQEEDASMTGQSFQLLPFGAGRRMCPGMTFALQVSHLALARLLHGFELEVEGDELVDMSEGCGLTMPKVTPLNVILKPRLPSHLYKH